MIEYVPIILICAYGQHHTECKVGGAGVDTVLSEPQNTPQACLMEGEIRLSKLAFAPALDSGYYYKVRCVPREKEKE